MRNTLRIKNRKKDILLIILAVLLIILGLAFIIISLLPEEIFQKQILPAPAPNKVLDLAFDENSGSTAYDSSGLGNNGTLLGGTSWKSGIRNSGLSFDGVDDYLSVPRQILSNEQTVAFWMKAIPSVGNVVMVSSLKWSNYNHDGFSFYLVPSGSLYLAVHKNSTSIPGQAHAVLNTSILTNVWHYVAGSWDNVTGEVKLYVDGVLVDSAGGFTKFDGIPVDLDIGRYNYQDNAYFNGSIDEVKIWNRALTAEEIKSLYEADTFLGYWNFDENSGSVARDSMFGDNGTIYGASWTAGIRNSGLSFDGVDDYVNISGFNISDTITLAGWVKSADYDLSIPFSLNADNNIPEDSGPNLFFYGGKINWNKGDGAINNFSVGYPNANWHYFTIVNDKSNNIAKLYIDGLNEGNASYRDTTITNNLFRIGAWHYAPLAGGYYFNGTIDEVKIWNRALNNDEIMQEYTSNTCGNNIIESGELCDNETLQTDCAGLGYTGGNISCLEDCSGYNITQCYNISRDLVLYLKLDENSGNTTYDSSSYGNNGTIYGNPTFVSGVKNGALNLDGEADYINVSNYSSLAISNAITISMWIKPEIPLKDVMSKSTWHIMRVILNESDASLRPNQSNNIKVAYSVGNANYTWSSNNALSIGRWNYLAYTHNGTEGRVYVNGKLDGLNQYGSGSLLTNNLSLLIGSYNCNWTSASDKRCFNGSIDEVKIWRVSLNESDIFNEYLSNSCGNGIVDSGEGCDLNNITKTCSDFGFNSGSFACDSNCGPDIASCYNAGDDSGGGGDDGCFVNCSGKSCGAANGCGGKCIVQTCAAGSYCNSTGSCVVNLSCVPSCENKRCGSDGCSGSCGNCASNQYCDKGSCTVNTSCQSNCENKQCGDDGCGGSCGSCSSGNCKSGTCVEQPEQKKSLTLILLGILIPITGIIITIIIVLARRDKAQREKEGIVY